MFVPDYMFETVYDIPFELLEKNNITCLFLDIDNTLVPYDSPLPTKENLEWFEKLSQHGIRAVFVSNNDLSRVEKYAAGLGIPFEAKAGKPKVDKYKRIAERCSVDLKNCAAVGDQIFTDVVAAALLGVPSFLVKPIKDVETPFFKFKRFFEKPFLYAYRRKHRTENK